MSKLQKHLDTMAEKVQIESAKDVLKNERTRKLVTQELVSDERTQELVTQEVVSNERTRELVTQELVNAAIDEELLELEKKLQEAKRQRGLDK